MVFSSLLFLYMFLPLQLGVYFLCSKKMRNAVLLTFSLLFYAWAGPLYLLILIAEAFISYYLARKISWCPIKNKRRRDRTRRGYLITAVVLLLSVLVFFKYLSLCAKTINAVLGLAGVGAIPVPEIVLPIGISFYTFQLISYVVDVYKKRVKANESFYKVLLYASLFHQCIAGPIVRYETVAAQIEDRTVSIEDFKAGIMRFSVGMAKKALLANSCAKVSDAVFENGIPGITAQTSIGVWVGAIFFTLQIYLDFSAYSDMAIGMGRMVGFHYLENFNYPYIAGSIKEFWNRWHISLSTFFRDYIYIPLGGNRVKLPRQILNLLIVWALTGLWHGASYNYVLWGLYYCLFLIIERYLFKNKSIKILGNITTCIIVIVGWVIFKCEDFDVMVIALQKMFFVSGAGVLNVQDKSTLASNIFLLIVSIIASTPLARILSDRLLKNEGTFQKSVAVIGEILLPVVLLFLSTVALVGDSYNPFLYFRF